MDPACLARTVLALAASATLAGCGALAGPAAPPAVAPPAVVVRPAAVVRSRVVASPEPGPPSLPGLRAAARPTWLVDPDSPLPRDSRWWPVLAVARRFAAADMSYQVDEVGPAVRRALARACTEAFAAELLGRPPSLPPGTTADQVRQRVVAITPLDHERDAALVLVSVRSNVPAGAPGERSSTARDVRQRRTRKGGGAADSPGAFELRLVPRPGGWRVAGLTVV